MKIKFLYIPLSLLLFFNCNKENGTNLSKDDFANKSFDFLIEIRKDTIYDNNFTISFKDSIYQIIDLENDRIRYGSNSQKWNIRRHNNIDFLVMNNSVILIKRLNDSTYKGPSLSYQGVNYKLSLRRPKWKKEKLYGKWVEDTYIGKPEDFFPPPPLPIPEKYDWPPYYEITKDKIVNNHYNVNESKYEINNSNEYISMELQSYFYNKEIMWKIKKLTDSVMVISRKIDNTYQDNYSDKFSDNIRLIKTN